jgi:hypothetical protein
MLIWLLLDFLRVIRFGSELLVVPKQSSFPISLSSVVMLLVP